MGRMRCDGGWSPFVGARAHGARWRTFDICARRARRWLARLLGHRDGEPGGRADSVGTCCTYRTWAPRALVGAHVEEWWGIHVRYMRACVLDASKQGAQIGRFSAWQAGRHIGVRYWKMSKSQDQCPRRALAPAGSLRRSRYGLRPPERRGSNCLESRRA